MGVSFNTSGALYLEGRYLGAYDRTNCPSERYAVTKIAGREWPAVLCSGCMDGRAHIFYKSLRSPSNVFFLYLPKKIMRFEVYRINIDMTQGIYRRVSCADETSD